MNGLSAKLPLHVDEVDGPYSLNKNIKEVARQNLKVLLLTSPGERMFNNEFGVGLRRRLFEHNTIALQTKIISDIRSQVSIFLPYITILDVRIFSPMTSPNMDENSITLRIVWSTGAAQKVETLFFNLGGTAPISVPSPGTVGSELGNFTSGGPKSGQTLKREHMPWDPGSLSVINVPY